MESELYSDIAFMVTGRNPAMVSCIARTISNVVIDLGGAVTSFCGSEIRGQDARYTVYCKADTDFAYAIRRAALSNSSDRLGVAVAALA